MQEARRAALIALAVVVVDQLTKLWIVRALAIGESRPFIGSVLKLTHVRNTGIAFGLLRGAPGIILLAAAAGVAIVTVVIAKSPGRLQQIAAGLVGGGAVGNIIDRIARGGVVDFFDLGWWPAFNIADACICVGAGLLLLASRKPHARDGR